MLGSVLGRTGLRVPRPAVPRAHDLAALDHSLPQRPAAMQADVVHGAVRSVHVGDADHLGAAGKFFGFVGGGSSDSVVSLMKFGIGNQQLALGS